MDGLQKSKHQVYYFPSCIDHWPGEAILSDLGISVIGPNNRIDVLTTAYDFFYTYFSKTFSQCLWMFKKTCPIS